ncbi:hypothetical protein Tco_0107012, partial [Tanacetum coccineum]
HQNPIPNVAQDPVIPTGSSVSMAIDLDAPSGSQTSSPLDHHGVAGEQYIDNAVLLWSSWNSLLMKNSYLFIMVIQSFVDKFCAIVGADESYNFVEADLNLLQKFDDNCRCFIL